MGTKEKIIIGVSVALAIAGAVGVFFFTRKPGEGEGEGKQFVPGKVDTNSTAPATGIPKGASSCERIVENHDSSWNYAKCIVVPFPPTWYTQRKGSSSWTSLANNTAAINKLEAYSGN
jgi:hypothetical protein